MRPRPLAVGLFVLLAANLTAQSITGSVTGVVTDSSGAVIAGAEVNVLNQGTNIKSVARTDSSGNYAVQSASGVGNFAQTNQNN